MTLLEAPDRPTRRGLPRAEAVIRASALVLIVVGWLGMLATAGQHASFGQLVSDLQHHRTSHVVVVDDRAVWRDGALRSRELSLKNGHDEQGRAVWDATSLADDLERHYDVPRDAVRTLPLSPRAPLVLGEVIAFLVLIGGPQPWRFNRWGWFWLLQVGRGIGLGAAGFLVLSTAVPWRHSPPGRVRGTGWSGFAWSLLLGLGYAVVAFLLRDWLLPDLTTSASWMSRS